MDDSRLASALQLARAVNALRALTTAGHYYAVEKTPPSLRETVNMVLYLGATFYEALLISRSVGASLKENPAYRSLLAPFLKRRDILEFQKRDLKRLRNEVVFHFDANVLRRILNKLEYRNFVFTSFAGGDDPDRYYLLADMALIPACFSDAQFKSIITNYQSYAIKTIDLTKEYCVIVDKVIMSVVKELSFSTRLEPEDGMW
jgi:hypothetical protein